MSRLRFVLTQAVPSLLGAALLLSQPELAAAEPRRGVFGLTLAVSGDGVFNPVVQSARITQVQPGMPAAAAGIGAGDEVVEVDGRRVVGATARELAPLAQGKRVGESVSLVVRRPDGRLYRVTMVAVEPAR